MKLTEEHYKELMERDHLNNQGLSYLIGILDGKIQDRTDRITEVTKEKGLHQRQIK